MEINTRRESPECTCAIAALEDEKLYTAAMVARHSVDQDLDPEAYDRLRKTLGEFARYHQFPSFPDGKVKQYKAWYGKTWKAARFEEEQLEELAAQTAVETEAAEVVTTTEAVEPVTVEVVEEQPIAVVSLAAPQAVKVPTEVQENEAIPANTGGKLVRFPKLRNKATRLLAVVTMVAMSFGVGIALPGKRSLKEAILEEGPKEVLLHPAFSEAPTETVSGLYSKAWLFYKTGNYDKAFSVISRLQQSDPIPALEAGCSYLLGLIYFAQDNFEAAEDELHTAKILYSQSGLLWDSNRASLVLAEQYLASGFPELASIELDEVELKINAHKGTFPPTELNKNLAFLNLVRFQVSLVRTDFLLAKDQIQESRALYHSVGDTENYAKATLYLGMVLGLLGDHEEAFKATLEGQKLSSNLGNSSLTAISLINFSIIDRCRFGPQSTLLEELNDDDFIYSSYKFFSSVSRVLGHWESPCP